MSRGLMALAGGALALLPAYTCAGGGDGDFFEDAPDDEGIPFDGPPGNAPTGQRFEDVEVQDGCGRTTLAFRLVDEMCGAALGALGSDDTPARGADVAGVAAPADLAAPMLRDGAFLGDTLYAVDGASLWVIDATAPDTPTRRALATGVGQALAVAVDAAAPGGLVHVAAGDAGVITLAPSAPGGGELAVVDAVPFYGTGVAIDIALADDGALLVALGDAGLAVITGTGPLGGRVVDILDVGGPAVAVTVADGRAYVATCDGLAIVDVDARTVLGAARGEAFAPSAIVDGVNYAPAKDVALDAGGGVAYVAAGRFGVVGVDVTDAAAPRAVGQCTDTVTLAHYVSGVKVDEAGRLVIAAGERGVFAEDDPLTACASAFAPSVNTVRTLPLVDAECTPMPPWSVLDIVTWEPPPPHHDPVQIALHTGRAFAFGDARRNSIRAVDVWTMSAAPAPGEAAVAVTLERTGRYQEPRVVGGVAASATFVVVAGATNANTPGSIWRVRDALDGGALLVRVSDELLPIDAARIQGTPALRPDGTIAALAHDSLVIAVRPLDVAAVDAEAPYSGDRTPVEIQLPGPISPRGVAARADGALVLARANGVVTVTPDGAVAVAVLAQRRADAALAPDIVAGDDVVMAAPEWDAAIGAAGGVMTPHGAFDAGEILDLDLWRTGAPRRTLAVDAGRPGVVLEVAAIADRGALVLHGAECRGAIPPAPYIDAALVGDRAFLVATDTTHYRSQLVTIDVGGAVPAVVAVDSFNGAAVSLASAGGRVYLADAEGALRIYAVADNALLGVVDVRGGP